MSPQPLTWARRRARSRRPSTVRASRSPSTRVTSRRRCRVSIRTSSRSSSPGRCHRACCGPPMTRTTSTSSCPFEPPPEANLARRRAARPPGRDGVSRSRLRTMRIDSLQLTNFRSYASLEASFPPGPQVVVGGNATGKTNLLESLVVLGTARSHRAGQDGELISWGADFARLEAGTADDAGGGAALEGILARSPGGGSRKRILVNGVARRPAALAGTLPVVLFAPEDMLLI